MSFINIIGQPFAVGLCRRWLAQETTQPLLFFGPDGVGKRTLALEVSRALNCANNTGDGCGSCPSCRKITAGTHPDVRVLGLAWQAVERKEPLEKQQNLRIETVLAERHRLLQSPVEGRWKVSIVDDAHRLTPDAANVWLKILEEPPSHTALFLLTPYRDRLLATLVSRCQPVRFRPLSDEEVLKVLGPGPVASIELAQGSPGRALHMSREEQIQTHEEAEILWDALPTKPFAYAKMMRMTRNEIEQRLHGLLVPATRAMRSGQPRAAEPVRLIQEALTQLRQNVSPALVYDNLLLQLARSRR